MASEKQLYDIDGFCSGLTVQFLVPMCEAAALCLQSFYERTQKRSQPKVTGRRKVILDSWLTDPLEARVIFSLSQESPANTEKVLMGKGIKMHE